MRVARHDQVVAVFGEGVQDSWLWGVGYAQAESRAAVRAAGYVRVAVSAEVGVVHTRYRDRLAFYR